MLDYVVIQHVPKIIVILHLKLNQKVILLLPDFNTQEIKTFWNKLWKLLKWGLTGLK